MSISYSLEMIQNIAYRKYQWDWLSSQGYSVEDLFELTKEWFEDNFEFFSTPDGDPQSFSEWFFDNGFGGAIYVCKDEFLGAEFQDYSYMKYLLSADEFKAWWAYHKEQAE